MKIISHRGNLIGPNPIRENSVDYIEEAITEGFDVEIDLRMRGEDFYLGHDTAQYFVKSSWLEENRDVLWIHCKELKALEKLSSSILKFNYFWHESDSYTITSTGIGWVYPGKFPYLKSVIVLPEIVDFYSQYPQYIKSSYGICTDTPIFYKKILENIK